MADTYLSRTPSSASNRKTWTISAWVKRGAIYESSGVSDDASQVIFGSAPSGTNYAHLMFTFDQMQFYDINSGTYVFRFKTNAEFRDPAAWYHVVISCDTTQATESNRFKWYINGQQITSWANEVYPSQNADTLINNNCLHTVGRYADASSGFFTGCMSEYHLIDGTAYDADTFGQTNSDGVWVPKVGPTVTYGTNGFYLEFANSGAMGTDSSGNSNTLALGGGTLRQVTDTPTNNFATLNPLNVVGGTLSNGSLYYSQGASWSNGVTGTQSFSAGKWYWETRVGGSYWFIGIQDVDSEQTADTANGAYKWTYAQNAKKYNDTTYVDYGATYAANDIIGVAYDADNGTLTFYKNGSSQGTAYTGLDTSKLYTAFVNCYSSNLNLNFGQNGTFNGTVTAQGNADDNGFGDFYYSPPTGYLALCTKNLATDG